MKKITISLLILFININVFAEELKNNISNKVEGEFYSKIGRYTQNLSLAIADKLSTYERIKHLDLSVGLQEKLKPTFKIESVNSIFEHQNSAFFNQTSILHHDGGTTINFGLGDRTLIFNDTVMLGFNTFLDYQIEEEHLRNGAGFESITNVFDLRGNFYNALSGSRTTDEGSEKALDGHDYQFNLHLNNKYKTDIFINTFKFRDDSLNYTIIGEKFGITSQIGLVKLDAGYIYDNKDSDGYFGKLSLVIPLDGSINQNNNQNDNQMFSFTSVKDKLYIPVQRENKIKLVKISKNGVKVGGF